MSSFKVNKKYKIKTQNGFEDFSGIAYNGSKHGRELILTTGESIKATYDHKFVKDGESVLCSDLKVGDHLDGNGKRTMIESIIENVHLEAFDILNLDNESHTFLLADSNETISSNCDELAFVQRRVAHEFWTSAFPALACVVAGTMVLSKNGFKPIESYFPDTMKVGDYLEYKDDFWTMNGMSPSSHIYLSPENKTRKITTESGYEVEVTVNHPLYSINSNKNIKGEMVEAKDLKVGNLLRTDIGMMVFGNDYIHKEQAYNDGLKLIDIERLYTTTLGSIRQYLGGVFDSPLVTKNDVITIWTLTKKQAKCLKLVLANLGVFCRIHTTGLTYKIVIDNRFSKKLKSFVSYRNKKWDSLLVEDDYDFIIDNNYIKDTIARELKNRGKSQVIADEYVKSRKSMPYSSIERYRKMGCNIHLNTDVLWDKIVKIEDSTASVTYDFTIPVTHSFLQDGIMGSNTGGKCIITSTPTDDETLFADIWKKANDTLDEHGHEREGGLGSNEFRAYKAKWDEHPERDEEYKKLNIAQFGEEKFLREHELEFIPDLETLISPKKLSVMKDIDPLAIKQDIRWYKAPSKDYMYFIGYDPSSGTGGDYSAIEIYEFPTMEQVGEWMHNKTDISDQIIILRKILEGFKQAGFEEDKIWWTFENNGLGESVIVALKELENNDIEVFGTLINEPPKKGAVRPRKGMATTKSKRDNCLKMKKWIENSQMTVNSKALIKELKTFVSTKNSFAAVAGEHDDLVMASILCVRMAMKAIKDEEEIIGDLDAFNEFASLLEDKDDDEGTFFPLPVG